MAPSIRPATPDDAATLAHLHAGSFADAWSAASLAGLMASPGAFTLVAEEDLIPCGFVLGRAAGGEAEILTLVVRPEARGRGFGRALVRAAAQAAAELGATALFLEVAVDNEAALGLYAALGFAEAGRRKAYYARGGGPPIDALVLRVVLPLAPCRWGNGPEPG